MIDLKEEYFLVIEIERKVHIDIRHEIFPEFRNFPDLGSHSRGNPRSGLIFMGGGGGLVVDS